MMAQAALRSSAQIPAAIMNWSAKCGCRLPLITPSPCVRRVPPKPVWEALGVAGRVKALEPMASLFEQHRPSSTAQEIAEIIVREMGAPAAQADGSTSWALNHMRWNLDNAAVCLAPKVTFENAEEIHKVFYEPLGVAAVIAPWNFPQSNFVTGAFQPLLADNTAVYKLSEEVPMFGQLLDRFMATAELPTGVFTQVYGDGRIGEALARSAIDAIFFTGSSAVGRKRKTGGKYGFRDACRVKTVCLRK